MRVKFISLAAAGLLITACAAAPAAPAPTEEATAAPTAPAAPAAPAPTEEATAAPTAPAAPAAPAPTEEAAAPVASGSGGIALILGGPSDSSPFRADIEKGATDKARAMNANLTILTPTEGDASEQMRMVQDVIDKGVKGIIIEPIDSTILVKLQTQKAAGTEISVVSFESSPEAIAAASPYDMGALGVENVLLLIDGKEAPDKIGFTLCPPLDPAAPVSSPAFGKIFTNSSGFVEQDGLYGNPQGEVFLIRVIGVDPAAVETYTKELKVCFDRVPTSVEGKYEEVPTVTIPPGNSTDDLLNENVPDNPKQNLVILLDFLGATDPLLTKDQANKFSESIGEFVKEKEGYDESWLSGLNEYSGKLERKFLSYEDLKPVVHAIDYILDPHINRGVSHAYPERRVRSASETINVGTNLGSGSVTASLCRDSSRVDQGTASRSGQPAITLSSSAGMSTYDLGVVGGQDGSRYRASGRWLREWNWPPLPSKQSRMACR